MYANMPAEDENEAGIHRTDWSEQKLPQRGASDYPAKYDLLVSQSALHR